MPTEGYYQRLLDSMAALREGMAKSLAGQLIQNPQLADLIDRQFDDMLKTIIDAERIKAPPPDKGLAALIGVGPQAAGDFADTRLAETVEPYDETVTSERIIAIGDLYYIYQHERIGVFRVMRKLQELFRAGTVRLSRGLGAFGLYQYDRRGVLRYTKQDRLAAYRRAFGYGNAPLQAGARPNTGFHGLFEHFINQVTIFWRDKRISDVIRERAFDPSFGSIAIVRRAGLDLRNNLKWASYGHLNVLRVEVMQLLDEAFRILNADDIKRLFGADNAWDVIEEVLVRHFNIRLVTSPRQAMAVAGRSVLSWLAQPHILKTSRPEFEGLLADIASDAEEWLTSAQAMGVARRRPAVRVLPWDGQAPSARAAVAAPASVPAREFEYEV